MNTNGFINYCAWCGKKYKKDEPIIFTPRILGAICQHCFSKDKKLYPKLYTEAEKQGIPIIVEKKNE